MHLLLVWEEPTQEEFMAVDRVLFSKVVAGECSRFSYGVLNLRSATSVASLDAWYLSRLSRLRLVSLSGECLSLPPYWPLTLVPTTSLFLSQAALALALSEYLASLNYEAEMGSYLTGEEPRVGLSRNGCCPLRT